MPDLGRLSHELVESQFWNQLIGPMLDAEYQLTLEAALPAPNMEELARNQGYAACLIWLRNEIEQNANEYKEQNPNDV